MNPAMGSLAGAPASNEAKGSLRSEKIQPSHWERLAVVYVRQSTPQQVLNHQESTRLQYGLKARAVQLGWLEDRVLVIDDDLGKSGATAEGRAGFQRLVSEVTLGHVGIILGIEMSRLARSCKDWHQLLEVCGLFGTLIADLDGIYEPAHYNDRLLLGLKGTMSEAELHILKQRMYQGKLNKARRGELGFVPPTGYVRRPSGEVILDPDEQVQNVVRLVFRKFEELGTLNGVLQYLVKHDLQLGIHAHGGIGKGEMEWHRPNRMTLRNMLHNPIYAGAYAYGRRQADSRRKTKDGRSISRWVNRPDQWRAFLKDRLPSYISWDQYEQNLARLKSNQARAQELGAVRRGPSLLSGLLVCAKCDQRMCVQYTGPQNRHAYVCTHEMTNYGGAFCQMISGRAIDRFVSARVLEALAPAALELSLEAAKNLQRERDDLSRVWEQRLERARYEGDRAARQYRRVEPENRLVARQLEREWEEKLAQQKNLEEDFRRCERSQPRVLSEEEREAIRALAGDIPALWEAPTTTHADRKEILRQVVDRVIIDTQKESERTRIAIHWAGGAKTEGEMVRPVSKLAHLSYYPRLCERLRELAAQGLPAAQVAQRLNEEGYRPPKRRDTFGVEGVRALLHRLGLCEKRSRSKDRTGLGEDEWWLPELGRKLSMPDVTVYNWLRRGWIKARQQEEAPRRWILWADEPEIRRLQEMRQRPAGFYSRRDRSDDCKIQREPLAGTPQEARPQA